jgi:hypothetical protein
MIPPSVQSLQCPEIRVVVLPGWLALEMFLHIRGDDVARDRYKAYDGSSYDGRCSFFGGTAPLAEGLGWFIVVGTGAIFSLGVTFAMWLGERAVPSRHQKELQTVSACISHKL